MMPAMTTTRLAPAFAALALLTAGCGSGKDEGGGEATEGAKAACRADATAQPTGLPAAFPLPGELTITRVRKDGPTNVIDGYWSSGLDEAYEEYSRAVEQAGYEVLFTEKEERDAEISYEGSNRTGQIALRDSCTEADTVSVHITNRPA